MGVKDELAVGALARALVRTGMYVDAGIDTSAGLDNPRTYAAAILNDPDLAADGLHFVMVETLDRAARAASATDEHEEVSDGGPREAYWRAIAESALASTERLAARPAVPALDEDTNSERNGGRPGERRSGEDRRLDEEHVHD